MSGLTERDTIIATLVQMILGTDSRHNRMVLQDALDALGVRGESVMGHYVGYDYTAQRWVEANNSGVQS